MDNLLCHSRVIAHLSRYSLQASSTPKKFFVILSPSQQTFLTRTNSIPAIASAFGCAGFILVGQKPSESEIEQKDDENRPAAIQILGVETMKMAYQTAREELGCEVIGVCAKSSVETSVSLSHPKAFSRQVAFVFLDEPIRSNESNSNEDLAAWCDRFVHISSSLLENPTSESSYKSLTMEACASIALHRFVETRANDLYSVDPTLPPSPTTLRVLKANLGEI
jgi:hypothetical protein